MWGGGHTRPGLSRGQLGTQHRKGRGVDVGAMLVKILEVELKVVVAIVQILEVGSEG
jgi:hypothetical protein